MTWSVRDGSSQADKHHGGLSGSAQQVLHRLDGHEYSGGLAMLNHTGDSEILSLELPFHAHFEVFD
jgi:hypothetical protein